MILSGHGKGNCDKLVIEFLSTLESATSWFDIRVLYIRLKSKGVRESMEQRGEQTELQLRS